MLSPTCRRCFMHEAEGSSKSQNATRPTTSPAAGMLIIVQPSAHLLLLYVFDRLLDPDRDGVRARPGYRGEGRCGDATAGVELQGTNPCVIKLELFC